MSPLHPTDPGLRATPVSAPAELKPTLFVVVDTEEEFDWARPLSRDNTSVTAIRRLPTLQTLLDRFDLRPTYVIDYPIATTPLSVSVIRDLYSSGRCAIGAHLHPWVNPPFVEPVTRANSFACNLGESSEEAKLRQLTIAIGDSFGIALRIYKAGRYGFGQSTAAILERLGYEIDVSVNPAMDYSGEGGPDFRAFDARPFQFGVSRRLLEVPCTTAFTGPLRRYGPPIHTFADTRLAAVRMNGVLCRSGLLNRISLSPELSTLAEMKALTRTLVRDGVRTFSLTLHSPSVEPGHTPSVRSAEDVQALMRTIEEYCEFFMESGGVPGTLDGFRRLLTPVGVS